MRDFELQELDVVKSEVGRSTIVAEHKPLAILLRNCYGRHPEFRLLLDALRKEGPIIYFPDLLRRLVHEYPNVFLNTCCTRAGRTRTRELIEAGQASRIYEEDAVWKDIIRTNVLFNFVQQLKHIGVLAAETRSHGGAISEYDADANRGCYETAGEDEGLYAHRSFHTSSDAREPSRICELTMHRPLWQDNPILDSSVS